MTILRGNIPAKDETFDNWQANLLTILASHGPAWNLGSLTALQAAQTVWAAAWAAAKIKSSRSPAEVTTKDEAREAYEALLRPFIQQYIMVNPLISNSDRELMQIKPRETEHTPIPVPTTYPVIITQPEAPHRVKIFFKQQPDAEGVSRRGKPEGVQFCEVAYNYDTVPVSPEACSGKKLITRSPEVANFELSEAGKKVYLFARWVNPRGEGGPWTDMVQFMVP